MINAQLKKGTLRDFLDIAWKKEDEEISWQFYLSRVWDKSFMQWKEGLKNG